MLNGVLEEIGDGIDTRKDSSSVSGIVGGGAAGWLIPTKSLAEIVRMPERRGVVYLYCGTVGVVGAETEDVRYLGHGSYQYCLLQDAIARGYWVRRVPLGRVFTRLK